MGNALGGSVFVVAGIVVLYMISTGRMQELLTGTNPTIQNQPPKTSGQQPPQPTTGHTAPASSPVAYMYPYQNLTNPNILGPMRVA